MKRAMILAVLAGGAFAMPGAAQTLVKPGRPQVKLINPDRGLKLPVRTIMAMPLVRNPDGSFVSDIDGKRRDFGFRPGSIHSIRGKGFGRRSAASTIVLKSDDGRYAATLDVTRWEDDLIVAQVPTDQAGFPSADALTLIVMTGPGDGGPRQFVVKGGRYAAEEAEVPLPLSANDRVALTGAGLRWRVWNVGKEDFTFERDGAITVTHYVDYPKDRRTTPCPGPGSERINLTRLGQALGLRGDFRISRIEMSNAQTNGHFTGGYGKAWQKVDDTTFFKVDWGVWRLRRDASFSLNKPFDIRDQRFGKHIVIPNADKVFTACGSEFTLSFFVTGPRGVRPR